ncbi:MAG: hypothetical protein ACHREM_13635 [Polyangiales bacterium]
MIGVATEGSQMWKVAIGGGWQRAVDDETVVTWIREGHVGRATLVQHETWPRPMQASQVAVFEAALATRNTDGSRVGKATGGPSLTEVLTLLGLSKAPPWLLGVGTFVVLVTIGLVLVLPARQGEPTVVQAPVSPPPAPVVAPTSPPPPPVAASVAPALAVSRESIVGAWRVVVTNPATPNAVASDYMRHVFRANGTVDIREEEEGPAKAFRWTFEGGQHVVAYKMGAYSHPRRFHFRSVDEVEEVDTESGRVLDVYLREGGAAAGTRTSVTIFQGTKMPGADPEALVVGAGYRVSRDTSLMPDPDPADPLSAAARMQKIKAGAVIDIVSIRDVSRERWYQVRTSIDGRSASGWVMSVALIGQDLQPKGR